MKNLSKKKLIWLIVITLFVIIEIKAFTGSRADKLLEINANIVDASGLLDVEKVTLDASSQNESGYYVILPEGINGRRISRFFIEEKTISDENIEETETPENKEDNNLEEPTTNSIVDKTTENENSLEENTTYNQESLTEPQDQSAEQSTEELVEQSAVESAEELTDQSAEQLTEESAEKPLEETIKEQSDEIIDNIEQQENEEEQNDAEKRILELEETRVEKASGDKLFLTNEELNNKEITLTVEYLTKEGPDDSLLYYKHMEKQVDDNNVIIEGFVPVDAEIKAEAVQKDNIDSLVDEYVSEKSSVKKVLDIKIVSQGQEFEPGDFGEEVKVYITNLEDIDQDSQMYRVIHIKEDESTEEVKTVETNEDYLKFRTNGFSEYAIILENTNEEETTDSPNIEENPNSDSESINIDLSNLTVKSTVEAVKSVGDIYIDEQPNVWDGSVATSFKYGSGTSSDPYLITTGAELAYLAQRVNAGNNFAGQVFQLVRDIDLNGRTWTPIGTDSNSFRGIFNGSGRTIKNANITATARVDSLTTSTFYSVGFFGSLGGARNEDPNPYTIVENVVFDDINISLTASGTTTTSTPERGFNIGIVTGVMFNHSEITNVIVKNSAITSTQSLKIRSRTFQVYVGGIAGCAVNSRSNNNDPGSGARYIIKNCYVDADLNLNNVTNNSTSRPYYMSLVQTGGIIGNIRREQALPEYCLYTGTIRGNGLIGPIFGGRVYNLSTSTTSATYQAVLNSYWNGTQDGTDLSMTSYYTNVTINSTYSLNSSTYTVTSGTSTNYISNSYMGKVEGINRGIYVSSRSTLISGFNSRTTDNVSWIYENGDLDLMPKLTVSATETAVNNFKANVSDPYNVGTYTYKWYNNGTADTTNTTDTYSCAPSYTVDQDIVLMASDGQYYALVEFVVEKLYINIEFDIDHPTTGTVTAKLVGTALPYIDPEEDYTYTWYKEDIFGESEEIEGADGLVLNGLEEYYDYRLVATHHSINELSDEDSFTYGDRTVVFCRNSGGSDYNDGWTPTTPVKTLSTAYQKLNANKNRNGNIIVLMGSYAHDSSFMTSETSSTYNKQATITGKYKGTDYDGVLSFIGSPGDTDYPPKFLTADTTFAYLDFNGAVNNRVNTSYSYMYFFLQGYSLTIGEDVSMINYTTANTYQGLIGNDAPGFHVFGGWLMYDYASLPKNNAHIVIKSGQFGRLVLGSSSGLSDPTSMYCTTSHNFVGSNLTDDKFVSTCDIDIKNSTTDYDTYSNDVNLLVGGSASGNQYSSVTLNISNGKVGRVLGGSIGDSSTPYPASRRRYDYWNGGYTYTWATNWNNPMNTYFGSSTINVTGGTVTELYGASLGRNMDAINVNDDNIDNPCDAFYYGNIEINISGGEITRTIYGVGAGAVTGYSANSSDQYKNLRKRYRNICNN